MHFNRMFVVILSIGAAAAQSPEEVLRSKIAAVRYGPLAEQARIQGDVHLSLRSGLVTVLSGQPILVQTAVESAKAIGSLQGMADVEMIYHFVLIDTVKIVPTANTVKRGNRFERAVLRMLGLKTEKVVQGHRCESGTPPANVAKHLSAVVEIWIYGTTHCLETQSATLLATR